MTIVVHELNTEPVRMKIEVGSKPIMIYALRPYIYKHGSPSGSVYLQIQDALGNKIKDSESISISSLSVANYFHGFYKFLVTCGLSPNTEYCIEMKTTGYTYASNAYIGWCNSFAFKNSFEASYGPPSTGLSAPLALQIWAYEHRTKGDY